MLFCFDGISFSRHIIDVPGPGQVNEIESALSLPQGTVSMAVGVSERPEDFVAMELLCILVVQAHQPRPIAFMRLTLLDLEIIEPNDVLPGVFQRTVKWLPHTTTRLSLFRVLGLEPLLALHEEKTHLWLNNELVDPMSNSALTIEDGDYVKIFIGDDEFRFQCDVAPDEMALLQITTNPILAVEKLGLPVTEIAPQIADENERSGSLIGPGLDDDVVGHPAVISCSFTDEFLRAVDALRTATEATPEFPEDDPGDLSAYDFWVQRLHEAWTQFATVGPGGMERLGRVETWFNDHTNFQRCHHTRIAVLGPDAHRWEEQLRHLWRQYILPGAPLEFYMVEPTPEDASGQIIGQLILVQRPHHLQRSVVISTYDTEYDQGRAHSLAVVMGDHVDLHSVCTMLQAHDDCPPERPENACSLWEGPRLVEPSERVYARHGSVFKFVIRRSLSAPAGYPSGTNLQNRMATIDARMHASHQQRLIETLPLWLQALHRIFQDLAETEREDEGPVAYVTTWYLHASYAPRCDPGRNVRLRDDPRDWQRTLLEAWDDRRESCRPADLFWVTPAPPTSLTDHVLGHILIVQGLPVHSVATLLTARVRDHEGQALHRTAVCIPQSSSAEDIVAAFPIPGPLLRFPRRVGRGQTYFAPYVPSPVASGESLVIDIFDPTPAPTPSDGFGGVSLLQTGVRRISSSSSWWKDSMHGSVFANDRASVHPGQIHDGAMLEPLEPSQCLTGNSTDSKCPVTLSLESCLADLPQYKEDSSYVPEGLCWTTENWPERIAQAEVQLAWLPEGLNLKPVTYHALCDPRSYLEPSFVNSTVLFVDGSASVHGATWSLVRVDYDYVGVPALVGCAAGDVVVDPADPLWIGADHADNISAELTAVASALVASLCSSVLQSVIIRPDLRLSAMLTEGLWHCKTHTKLARLCRTLGQWFHKVHGRFCEVRGHAGDPWNELADSIARHQLFNHCSLGSVDWSPFASLVQSDDLDWAWLLAAPPCLHRCLPPGSENGIWQITPSCLKPVDPPPSGQHHDWDAIDATFLTANVLALGKEDQSLPPEHSSDRALRLDHQWHSACVLAAGLQETRRPQGCIVTDHYFGFASGPQICERAHHFGCELWLHKTRPLVPNGTLTFKDFKAVVAHADPRRLIVNLTHRRCALSFVVLHVPCKTAQFSIEDLQNWWMQTTTILRRANVAALTWCFADANAPLASAATELYGDFGAERGNPQGELLENALQELNWAVPSTFAWCHSGPHHTWTHPKGTKLRRDYIFCSAAAHALSARSWTALHHDGGFAHEDHIPLFLHVSGWIDGGVDDRKPLWDPLAFIDPDICHRFQEAVHSLPIPSWSTHVDSHAAYFESAVLNLAKQFFTKKAKRRSRPRLAEATLNLIAFKRTCLDYGRRNGLMQEDDFKVQLKEIESEVRRLVRADQRRFYADLVAQLAAAGSLNDCREVHKLLRRLGGRRPKGDAIRPLPLICHEGKPVTSFVEQQRLWLRQFAAVEAANVIGRSEFLRLQPAHLGIAPDVFDFATIPTLAEVQAQIHGLRRGKAPGPDGIPPDVLKAGAEPLAKHLTVLTSKAAAQGREPVSWKGGHLIPLHKGKSSRSDPLGYRSIFLNNFCTKVYHSMLRKHLVWAWASVLEHIQFGGRKKVGCDSAHHLVQAHLAHGAMRKDPVAVLFVDFKSAFYTVLRQGLFADAVDATGFIVAMHRLGIAPEHVDRLLCQAQHDCAVTNISPHAALLLRDVLTATCFEVDGIEEVAATHRGTRPGDPIGDIAFNLTMAVILKDITSAMTAQPAEWEGDPRPPDSFCDPLTLAPMAWAEVAYVDDLAVLLRAPSNEELVDLAKAAVSATMQATACRGLELTFGAGKTELLLALRGAQTRSWKEKFHQAGQTLSCQRAEQDDVITMPVVLSYKHLGTWVHNDGKPMHAVRERVTAARKAWGPLVRPLFAKRCVEARTKLQVFESLVLSRFLFNVHTWSYLPQKALDAWENGLRPMLYALAKAKLRGLPPFTFSTSTLCGLCGLLTPRDALHLARLRYVKRLLTHCPAI